MASLCERIKDRRRAGRTICGTYHGKQVLPRKERLRTLGLNDIPSKFWVQVARAEALELLTDCLTRDLAYQSEIMPVDEAQSLARAFVDMFGAETEFRTNTQRFLKTFDPHGSYSWEPVTDAMFDTGIIAELHGVVGILWVADED